MPKMPSSNSNENPSTEKPSERTATSRSCRFVQWLAVLFALFAMLPYVIFIAARRAQHHAPEQKLYLLLLSAISLVLSFVAMSERTPIPQEPFDAERGTWFGHLMSPEGEWTNIPIVLCATYSFVFLYGSCASLATNCHVLCIPIFYAIGLAVFYLWHVAAHVFKGTGLNRIHMIHHQDTYPRQDFYGDECPKIQQERSERGNRAATLLELMRPGNSTTATLAHEGPIVLAIIAIVVVARFGVGLSTGTCLFAFFGYIFMGTFGSAIHKSFHERGFDLEPYAWYRELRSLHMIHHMHRKNYAMVNILLDLVFCSLLVSE